MATTTQGGASTAAAVATMVPSQVLMIQRQLSSASTTSSRSNRGGANNDNANKKQKAAAAAAAAAEKKQKQTDDKKPRPKQTKQEDGGTAKKRNRNRRRGRNGNNKTSQTDTPKEAAAAPADSTILDDGQPSSPKQQQQQTKKKKNRPRPTRRARREYNQKKFPWRPQIPAEAVDPITLEPLDQLRYPPFALAAVEPYEPIPVWPIPDTEEEKVDEETRSKATTIAATTTNAETQEERQRRILAEQWAGTKHSSVIGSSEDEETKSEKMNATTTTTIQEQSRQPRHLNLYDGRALAYYMVSQLQFIDPLNRRDLTRDEIVNLDHYLRRHGFLDLNVTEAYDAKGVSISTASAVGNTARGRAAILQQEASALLQALFGGGVVSSSANVNEDAATTTTAARNNNRLMSQYLAHEQAGVVQQTRRRRHHHQRQERQDDAGVYGDAGFLVIDDDLNPGLRGDAPEFVPGSDSITPVDRINTLWSASHIASRYGHATRVQEHEFPSLGETATPAAVASTETTDPAAQEQQQSKKQRPPPPPSKTLSKIGSLVKKTDPEELQRQFEAREEARRRAMMSNLTFQSNPAALMNTTGGTTEIPSSIVTTTSGPTEGQLERNRAFAEALEIKPATARQQISEGWARPTEGRLELDEFGNELNTTVYPDSLILQARERMPLLLKLEKKWKTFLADDSSASLPLNKMDRPSRTFVHAYSDYWKLHTESFDPEPRRYIHCVKLRDTSAPYPLLSDAVRNWRGPRPLLLSTRPSLDHPSRQTAGQSTKSNNGRSLPPAPDRTPLQLKPPAVDPSLQSSGTTEIDSRVGGIPLSGAPSRSSTQEGLSGRFASLLSERERPKLELQKRTLPVELPPVDSLSSSKGFDVAGVLEERQRMAAEKERQQREQELAKQRILEAAFASDDEHSVRAGRSDSSSEWGDEPEALYASSDEDEL